MFRRFRAAGRWKWLIVALAGLGIVVFSCWQASHRLTRIAIQEANREQLSQALERLHTARTLWPWNVDAHFWTARTARMADDMKTAEKHLNRCRELDGGPTERVQLEFLLMRVQSGEIDELAPTLFGLVEREGGYPDTLAILRTLGRAYILRLRYRPAYACMSKWIEIRPDDPYPYQYRGWALERLGSTKPALADYHKALELNPDLVEVRLRVVEMHLEEKQAPEAMPHAEWLYQRFPNDHRVRARLGMCQFLMGQGTTARELMESAEPHLADDPALLVALANLDLQDQKPMDAERRLRKVLAIDSSDTEAMFVLANTLQILGKTDESIRMRDECLVKRKIVDRIYDLLKDQADTPNARPDVYVEIGELFFQIGKEKFGVYWVEQALERDAAFQRAHRVLADYYEKKGDRETAALHRRQVRTP